jgi:putative polyhydroxyalkanoate system protein
VADMHIRREHQLGLPAARKVAFKWAEQVEADFGMECAYQEGLAEDLVTFKRSGVNGVLRVADDHFNLDAKLGFLLGAFKGRIEAEIVKNLDTLLAAVPVKKATSKRAATKKK